jgi:hypothetical protein
MLGVVQRTARLGCTLDRFNGDFPPPAGGRPITQRHRCLVLPATGLVPVEGTFDNYLPQGRNESVERCG